MSRKRLIALSSLIFLVSMLNGTRSVAQDANNGSSPATNPTNPSTAPLDSTESTPPDKVPGMYDGMFKCSDGYDPDTDPSLHPDNQSPKIRMLVNAKAQQDHEEKVKADKEKGEGTTMTPPASSSAGISTAGSTIDPKKSLFSDGIKKDSADKKDGGKDSKTGEKKDSAAKKGEADDEKVAAKKDSDLKKGAQDADASKEAYNPLKEALFDIQTGNFKKSAALLDPLLQKEPKNVQAHYLLAVTYVGMRNYPQATDQYKLVLKLAPNSKMAQMATEGLHRISK